MVITKETFFIHLVCFGIAYLCLLSFESIMSLAPADPVKRNFTSTDMVTVTGVGALIVFLFYSGFLVFPAGILDFFRSFAAWVKTGQNGPHQKNFWYWAQLFMRYEWVSFVGLVLTIKLILPSARWLRLIGIYGFGVFLAYSLIPYKTPWCIMQLIWPFTLVAASILEDLTLHGKNLRRLALGALVVLALSGAVASTQLNFFHYADDQEPYVYVQTFSDIMPIVDKIKELAKADRNNLHMPMKVYLDSNWPIPWLFGDFTQVSYFGPSFNGNIDADVVFVDSVNQEKAEHLFTQNYFRKVFRLRSAQGESVVYFKVEKFRALFNPSEPIITPYPPLAQP